MKISVFVVCIFILLNCAQAYALGDGSSSSTDMPHASGIVDFQKQRGDSLVATAGFESIINKPLAGQMEQLSNALAITQLGLGSVVEKLTAEEFENKLQNTTPNAVHYPDVAKMVAEWVVKGNWENPGELCRLAWEQVRMEIN